MEDRFTRLTLPASIQSLGAFLEFARAGAVTAGLSPADCDRLDLVLEELLVNVARYSYAPGEGEVELAYTAAPGKLAIQVSDQGRFFNPLDRNEPDLGGTLSERPVGGLGLFLVRELVRSPTYFRENGWNRLSFIFPGGAAGN